MRSNRTSEQRAAASRRLAQLGAELAAAESSRVDSEAGPWTHEDPWAAPPTHTRVRPERLVAQPWHEPAPPTRVRGSVVEGRPEAAATEQPPVIPAPGRHARRREGVVTGAIGRASAQARFSLGPAQLAVVGVLTLVALVVTGWWWFRAQPREVAAPSVVESSALAPSPSGSEALVALTGAAAGVGLDPAVDVVVDVAGKVRRPGIAVLPSGSRVVDALDAAGGARPGVDLTDVNLARLLVDGEQILVGVPGAPGVAAGALSGPGPAAGADGAGALVALNSADQTLLETLPDVGPVTAQAILAWRDQNGAFSSVDELLEVDGIGDATLARLAPLVTL